MGGEMKIGAGVNPVYVSKSVVPLRRRSNQMEKMRNERDRMLDCHIYEHRKVIRDVTNECQIVESVKADLKRFSDISLSTQIDTKVVNLQEKYIESLELLCEFES